MRRSLLHRLPVFFVFALADIFLAGCGVPLGPGYIIQKQNLELRFVPSPEPHLAVNCTYQLLNSGSQPLQRLRVLVPPADAFHRTATSAEWNGKSINLETVSADSSADSGDTLELRLPQPWARKQKRTLVLSYELATGFHLGSYLAVSPETFFAFADSWNPALLPEKHLLATGGGPPRKWNLSVRVPSGFLVHASGIAGKRASSHDEWIYSFTEQPGEFAPFAAGGKYVEREAHANGDRILFWTLQPVDPAAAQNAANSIASRASYYKSQYGSPSKGKGPRAIHLLECIVPEKKFGCGALPETILVDQAWIARGFKDKEFFEDMNFELAFTWFGGISRVRFDEGPLPMDAVAPYAGWEAQAQEDGDGSRAARIGRLLADFDKHSAACKEKIILPLPPGQDGCSYGPAWTKSALFLFAMEDKIGRAPFHQSLKYMIQARRGSDFRLQDLISAMEAESRQPQGPFVRQWLKHPGIPDDFRARYAIAVAPAADSANAESHSNEEPHP